MSRSLTSEYQYWQSSLPNVLHKVRGIIKFALIPKQNHIDQVTVATLHSLLERQLRIINLNIQRHLLRRLALILQELYRQTRPPASDRAARDFRVANPWRVPQL